MTPRRQWLLYGATGFTGQRIAQHALALGEKPVLAGRNAEALRAVAEPLGLEWRSMPLDNTAGLRAMVGEFSLVMHAAGPFLHTWRPMIDACLAAGTHYLDLAGEIPIYEGLAALDVEARAAGIMVMPGVGFDMVPSDCLALQLKQRLPDASELAIAISFEGTLSRGSIRSALLMERTTQVRRNHRLTTLSEKQAREFDFGPGHAGGRMKLNAGTFGDISIGWRTTGIPNITCYPRPVPEFLALWPQLKQGADVAQLAQGPSAEELASLPSIFIGEARNESGGVHALRLVTPQSYAITFATAAAIAQRVHAGELRKGFQTPASIYGADFILGFDGCSIEDWPPGP